MGAREGGATVGARRPQKILYIYMGAFLLPFSSCGGLFLHVEAFFFMWRPFSSCEGLFLHVGAFFSCEGLFLYVRGPYLFLGGLFLPLLPTKISAGAERPMDLTYCNRHCERYINMSSFYTHFKTYKAIFE